MPLAKAIRTVLGGLAVLAVAACEIVGAQPTDFERMPREVRIGAADMAIQPVEREVSREEVGLAVQQIISNVPVCFSWPGLWLHGADRRYVFLVRFDLMSRDWGRNVAMESQARMQEFVELGFLTQRERPEIGPGVIEYTLTPLGSELLRGSPYGGGAQRPEFCPIQARRLIDITAMTWGQFPCGNLRVGFTHVGDAWPEWAVTSAARDRIATSSAAPSVIGRGEVTLTRQWFRLGRVPSNMSNGGLVSACYDTERATIAGSDLNLNVTP